MIIKLQGMNNDTWFYDTESVRFNPITYTKEYLNTIDWILDLILTENREANMFKGYLFILPNNKILFTELDVWIDGELINV